MPRKYKLTWQAGTGRRTGRWRRKYQGKVHYFPAGAGKTDRQAYLAALAAWERLKVRLDGAAPKRHQRSYEQAIEAWEDIRAWCRKHGEQIDVAEMAEEKLTDLRKRLACPKLKPLDIWDTVESLHHVPGFHIPDDFDWDHVVTTGRVCKRVDAPLKVTSADFSAYAEELNGSPSRIAKEIWLDRLEVERRSEASPEEGVRAHVAAFLQVKEGEVSAQEITTGRLAAITQHLYHFSDWLGPQVPVSEINGRTLSDYRAALLQKVKEEKWSRPTASDRLSSAKSFIRWLWLVEAIPTLPRNMDAKSTSLLISRGSSEIVIYTRDEITTLLNRASNRTKLYILLAINTAATQKDIADLQNSEVVWDEARIVRKRSKTRKHDTVPVVNYRLWPETIRLLRAERAPGPSPRVLLNANGGPLWFDEMREGGRYVKIDNIKSAFDRLRRKTKISKSFIALKKTSASLIRENERFSTLDTLFLGQAPNSIAHKHYAQDPQRLLDAALDWLRGEYDLG
ncbi:tyrosine-type recombinase/integrase [Planctomycetota bacterium]